jgi:metal-responsive CopG/Arc/MetJ family transcriptional regulator
MSSQSVKKKFKDGALQISIILPADIVKKIDTICDRLCIPRSSWFVAAARSKLARHNRIVEDAGEIESILDE